MTRALPGLRTLAAFVLCLAGCGADDTSPAPYDARAGDAADTHRPLVDELPPTLVSATPRDGAVVGGISRVTLVFDDGAGSGVDLFVSDLAFTHAPDGVTPTSLAEGTDFVRVPMGADTLDLVITHPTDGRYTLAITPVDAAGNRPSTPTTVAFTADATAPAITPRVGDDAVIAGDWWPALDVTDLAGVAAVEVRLTDADGVDHRGVGDLNGGTIDTEAAVDGRASAHITVTDHARNSAEIEVSVVIDNDPPTLTWDAPGEAAVVAAHFEVSVAVADAGSGVEDVAFSLAAAPTPLAVVPPEAGAAVRAWLMLPAGDHVVEATATDRAGRSATDGVTVRVDDTPPTVSVAPAASDVPLAAAPRVLLSLSDEPAGVDLVATAAAARATWNGEVVTPVIEATDDGLSLTWPRDLGAGTLTVEVAPIDLVGNRAAPSTSTWTVDTSPPSVLLEPPRSIWGADPVTVVATATDDDVVATLTASLTHGGEAPVALGPADPSGGWTIAPATLAAGSWSMEVRATDRAGNVGTARAAGLVDHEAPRIAAVAPASGATPRTLPVRVEATDDLAGIATVAVTGPGDAVLASVDFPVPPTQVDTTLALFFASGGPKDLTVRVTDAAGHVATLARTWVIDVGVPEATFAPPSANVTALSPVTFTVSDDSSGPGAGVDWNATIATVGVIHDGLPFGGWSATRGDDTVVVDFASAPPDGNYTVHITPIDHIGNRGAESVGRYLLDTHGPAVSLVHPGEGLWTSDPVIAMQASVTDLTGVATVEFVAADDRGQSVSSVITAPPWVASLPTSGLRDGPIEATVEATDRLGNPTLVSRRVQLDRTPPSVEALAPEPGQSVGAAAQILARVADAGAGVARVEVRNSFGTTMGSMDGDGSTSMDANLSVVLTRDGVQSVGLWAFDGVGNARGIAHELTVDAVAPTVVATPPSDATLLPPYQVTLRFDEHDSPSASGVDLAASLASLTVPASAQVTPTADGATVRLIEPPSGVHRVTAAGVDRVGNVGARLALRYLIDRTPPVIRSIDPNPTHGTIAPDDPITIVFDGALDEASVHQAVTLVGPNEEPLLPVVALRDGGVIMDVFLGKIPAPGSQVTLTIGTALTDSSGNHPAGPFTMTATLEDFVFADVARGQGLADYRADTPEFGERHGPGAVFADVSGDDYPDVILTGDGRYPLSLWVNSGGSGAFQDAQLGPRVSLGERSPRLGTGAVVADYDNDGDRDVYAALFRAPNVLYQNQLADTGTLDFIDVTATTGTAEHEPGVAFGVGPNGALLGTMSCAWADVNRDGWPDLYVGSHDGHIRSPQIDAKPGERDTLLLNRADGTFDDVTEAANVPGWSSPEGYVEVVEHEYSSTNAVIFADLNNDRWPDLVVTNKVRTSTDRDMIYLNRGDDDNGTWLGFRPITYELGPRFGATNDLAMGVAVGDVDNDGDLDIYITDWAPFGQFPGPNELWINRFVETGAVGFSTEACCTGTYSWGTQLEDFDNDGLLDIHVAANRSQSDHFYTRVDGVWREKGRALGFTRTENARGSVAADFDRDGWLDLLVVHLQSASALYQNYWHLVAPEGRHWLSVRLIGDPDLPGPYRSSVDALGARVIVHADIDGDGVAERLMREIASGGSNATSSSSLVAEVGLGKDTVVDVEVLWPSGRTSWLTDVAADQHLVVVEE